MTAHDPKWLAKRWRRSRMMAYFACCLVFGLLGLYAVRTVQELRWQAREAACRGKLARIGVALHNYSVDHGVLPPFCLRHTSGRPMHSWRVLLLPYLCEDNAIYDRYSFSESWNGPRNSVLAKSIPEDIVQLFRCPNDAAAAPSWTSFFAVVPRGNGPDGRIGGARRIERDEIIIVELHESGVHWLEPMDLSFERLNSRTLDSKPGMKVMNFLTADGHVGSLSDGQVVFRGSRTELLQRWLVDSHWVHE